MGKEDIVNTILADAEREAQATIAEAQKKAAEIRAAAEKEAKALLDGAQAETDLRAKAICDGKEASARLDGAKILLAEKRRVIALVYARAYEKLLALGEKESISLFERLLKENAREGDELVLPAKFRYRAALEKSDVVVRKKLSIAADANIEGGFYLRGKNADVDLTYASLLAQDSEEHQSEIAFALFK